MNRIKAFIAILLTGFIILSVGCSKNNNQDLHIDESLASIDEAISTVDEIDNESEFPTETESITESITETSTEKTTEKVTEKATQKKTIKTSIKNISCSDTEKTILFTPNQDNSIEFDLNIDYDDNVNINHFICLVSDNTLINAQVVRINDHWFFSDTVTVKISALKMGKTSFYLESADGKVKSNKINIIIKDNCECINKINCDVTEYTIDYKENYTDQESIDFDIDHSDTVSKENFSYEVSDESIIKVESIEYDTHFFFSDSVTVKVKGLKHGKAFIILKSANGKVKSKRITVNVKRLKSDIKNNIKSESKINYSLIRSIKSNKNNSKRIQLGKSKSYIFTAKPKGITKKNILISTNKKKIIKIYKIKTKNKGKKSIISFKVKGLRKGKATLKVESRNSYVEKKIKITVFKPKRKVNKKKIVNKTPYVYNPTVYITPSGDKYHSYGCHYLRGNGKAISLSEAKARGKSPCSRCNPLY